jgi:hypothetical protein
MSLHIHMFTTVSESSSPASLSSAELLIRTMSDEDSGLESPNPMGKSVSTLPSLLVPRTRNKLAQNCVFATAQDYLILTGG